MNGLIVQSFGDFVTGNCSEGAKAQLGKMLQGVRVFATQDYPDAFVLQVVQAVAGCEGQSAEQLLERFGEFFVAWSVPKYRMAYAASGARDFLAAMGAVHTSVRNMNKSAKPPEFTYETPADGKLVMIYRSPRRLCPLMRGLFRGVAAHYGESIDVQETRCQHQGAAECRFELGFGGKR